MASVLGSAVLNLTTDATKLSRGLRQAEVDTDRSLTKMQRLGDAAAKAAPYAAIGAGAIAAGVGLKAMVDDVANAERELRPFLQRSNLTVESLQRWQEVGRRLGAEDPLEGITDSIQEFKLRLGELQSEGTGPLVEALPALGLALQDLQGKTPEEQFRTLLTALQGVDEETRRLYLADELFGGAMENIIGILQAQRAEFEAVEIAVRNTHNVLSGEELRKLHDYNQAVDEIGNSWGVIKQDLVTAVAPVLTGTLDHVNSKMGDFQEQLGVTSEFVTEWSGKAVDAFKQVGPGATVAMEEVVGVIGAYMTSEEADIAGYLGNQLPLIKVSWEEIAQVTHDGATDTLTRLQEGLSVETVNTHMALVNEAIAEAMRTTVTNAQETADQLVEIDTVSATERLTIVTQATRAWQAERDAAHAAELAAQQANNQRIEDALRTHTQSVIDLANRGREIAAANATAWANHMAAEAQRAASAAEAAARRIAAALASSTTLNQSIQGHQDFNINEWVRREGDPWNQFGGAFYENTRTGQKISTRLYQSRRLAYFKGQHNRVMGGAAHGGNPLAQDYFNQQPMPTLPGLPQMDSGGIVSRPTLAALAMNSRPEAVIPLDRMGAGGMGGVQIIFNDAVYGLEDFNEKVQDAVLIGRRDGRQDLL